MVNIDDGGIGFADPLWWGLRPNQCTGRREPPLFFVFRIWSKQACPICFKQKPQRSWGALIWSCGEGGIRTLDTSLSSYNGLANRPFRPLRHLSNLTLTLLRGSKNTIQQRNTQNKMEKCPNNSYRPSEVILYKSATPMKLNGVSPARYKKSSPKRNWMICV